MLVHLEFKVPKILHRLANLHHIIIPGFRHADTCACGWASITIEQVDYIAQLFLVSLAIGICTQQSELLSSKCYKLNGTFWFDTALGNQVGSTHHGTDTCTTVYSTCSCIIGIQVTADNHFLLRMLTSWNRSYYIVVFDRTQTEMVADIKL